MFVFISNYMIFILSDPRRFNLVELTLNIVGEQLTKSQEDSLRLKLSLLLKDNPIIQVQELREVSEMICIKGKL